MLSSFFEVSINTESKNLKVAKTKKGRLKLLSKWIVFVSKKFFYFKQQEASGI